MYVGNLVMGERFVQPYGITYIKNMTTEESCSIEFSVGGWKVSEGNVTIDIKDKNEKVRIQIKG